MTRTRSKTYSPVIVPATFRMRNRRIGAKWGSWSSNASINGNWISTDTSLMVDQVNPGYFKAKREGALLPVSPMQASKTSYFNLSSDVRYSVQNATNEYEFDFKGHIRTPYGHLQKPTPVGDKSDIALQEALSRARSRAWDTLTFAAEFRSSMATLMSLRQRVDSLYDLFLGTLSARRHGRRYTPAQWQQVIAEVWLEMRYAWRPILFDIRDANATIVKWASGVSSPMARGYATVEDQSWVQPTSNSSVEYRLPGGSGSAQGMRFIVTRTSVCESKWHASVGVELSTQDLVRNDPFVTAWELVPYTFILDWFLTVGTMISAFSPVASPRIMFSTVTRTDVITRTIDVRPSTPSGWKFVTPPDGGWQQIVHEVNTSRVLRQPTPTLAINIDLSWAKLLDLVALWVARNSKILSRLRHI